MIIPSNIIGGLAMNNAIIELLNIKEEDIESLSCHRLGEDLCIKLSLKRKQ